MTRPTLLLLLIVARPLAAQRGGAVPARPSASMPIIRNTASTAGPVGATIRAIPTRFPSLALIDLMGYENEVSATFGPPGDSIPTRVLVVRIESFDTDREALAAFQRAEAMTSVGPTLRQIDGMLRNYWGDQRVSALVGRHVVDIYASRPAGVALVRPILDSLVSPLLAIVPSRPQPPFLIPHEVYISIAPPPAILAALDTNGTVKGARYDLDGDGQDEWIVRLPDCGTGGCTTRIFDGKTNREIANIFGEPIVVRAGERGGPPILEVYSHASASSGAYMTYAFDRGRYALAGRKELSGAAVDSLFRAIGTLPVWRPGVPR